MNEPDTTGRLERVREILKVWAHNRELYPGWIVYPTGIERAEFKQRTDLWEEHILRSLHELAVSERLIALFELVWRKEVLLEPISLGIETAAQDLLDVVDCPNQLIDGAKTIDDDWDYLEIAWTTVALALVTDARYESNRTAFEKRLAQLEPFASENPDVAHRMHQERCLWAIHDLDFVSLDGLLDCWEVEDAEPDWRLRKAALLTEVGRDNEAATLIQSVLDLVNKHYREHANIASASLESWALASTVSYRNRSWVLRRWEQLSQYRADAGSEIEHVTRSIQGSEERKKPPSFDNVIGRSAPLTISNAAYTRMIAAYRGVRLPEVAGLPPSFTDEDSLPVSVASRVLKTAADELATFNPELSVRLAIRVSGYDGDETIGRVLSRVQIANMSYESLTRLGQICIDVIRYSLPHVMQVDEATTYRGGKSPVERLRVGMEALSRLVLRLESAMVSEALDAAVECYQSQAVVQNLLLGRPLQNLMQRVWSALPHDLRRERVFDLLSLPIVGTSGFASSSESSDPCSYVAKEDFPHHRCDENDPTYKNIVEYLLEAIQTGDECRSRAILRLVPLVLSDVLIDDEEQRIADALWKESDPVMENPRTIGSPHDWIFLVLPEPDKGVSESSFRKKWLYPDQSEPDAMYSSNVLSQVSLAINGMRGLNRTFDLSPVEQNHLLKQIERVIQMFACGSVTLDLGFSSRVRDIGPLLAAIQIEDTVAKSWSSIVEWLLKPPTEATHPMLDSLADMKTALGFALIPGLIKVTPTELEKVGQWITQGVTSPSEVMNREAIHVMRTWFSASLDGDLTPPPSRLVRHVGEVISSGRMSGLEDALIFAELVFEKGSQADHDEIRSFALVGLDHLAVQLRYDREQPTKIENVHTLRLLCVRLATTMAQHGYESNSTIETWLNIGENDPFPEVRNASIVQD